MAKVTGLDHFSIYTKDMEVSLDFYCEKLGFSLISRQDTVFGDVAFAAAGDFILELIEPPDVSKIEIRGEKDPVLNHIGLKVDNVAEIYAELKKKGVVFKSTAVEEYDAPRGGFQAVVAYGPFGETVNLYHFKEQLSDGKFVSEDE